MNLKKQLFLITFLLAINETNAQNNFTLMSQDILGQATKKEEFNGMGCTGGNISPQLFWKNPPTGTKSFAITMYDPNAPTGSGFWHWIVTDIPATYTELISGSGMLKSNSLPAGANQGKNDFGTNSYGGPCPPENHGIHQYIITIHALKVDRLGLDPNTSPAVIGFYLWQTTIEKASIVMYYERKSDKKF